MEFIYEGRSYLGSVNDRGEPDGFCFEYFEDGFMKSYEGEFVNGRKEGSGKIYNNNGILIYEGEFCNDMCCGAGKRYSDDGYLIHEGEFWNDMCHGFGARYENGELWFKGNFINGFPHGHGTLYTKDGESPIYEGIFRNGECIQTDSYKTIYSGSLGWL